jgi:2-keto-4-pentenoate hydratase
MNETLVAKLGLELASNRRTGSVSRLPLKDISSGDEAQVVQETAIEAFGGEARGYVLAATTPLTQRILHCDGPVFAPLLDVDILTPGHRFWLPHGVLGAGCSFAFVFGAPFPAPGESISRVTVLPALAGCRTCVDILGRRASADVPLNEWTATADFGLHVASLLGPFVDPEFFDRLAAVEVLAQIDGRQIASGSGRDIMSDPLEALTWLANALAGQGRQINAGDMVVVGSCTGILQVLPQQVFRADFGSFGAADITFV